MLGDINEVTVQRMRSVPLTDAKIKSLKPKEKSYKVADYGGLYVEVSPTGARLWLLKFRFEGREKRLSFGAYRSRWRQFYRFRRRLGAVGTIFASGQISTMPKARCVSPQPMSGFGKTGEEGREEQQAQNKRTQSGAQYQRDAW